MQSGFLAFNHSNIHYLTSGTGKKLLVCFHGYGERAANFNFLSQKLASEFTTISIDLPYHGLTEWRSGTVDSSKLKKIVQDILVKENLPDEFHLMGFSLGGRMALSLFQEMPDKVERLILLAPDGLKLNFWYWLSTQTLAGNKCFKWTMNSPGWFLGMLRIGNKVKLINRSIYKFVEYYIYDEQVRKELYDRWTSMRHCKPDLKRIRSLVQKNNTAVRLLYGNHDRIILPSPAKRFIDGLDNITLELLDCGHQVLHAKNTEQIVKALIN